MPGDWIAIYSALPPGIKNGLEQVFGRIASAIVSNPVAWLEGNAKITQAKLEAKAADIKSDQQILDFIKIEGSKAAVSNPEFSDRASKYFTANIFKEQKNREDVLKIAFEEIIENPPQNDTQREIEEDWLNIFLKKLPFALAMNLNFCLAEY